MSALVNLAGRRFGRLTVVDRAQSNKHKQAMWNCKCDCGGSKAVIGSLLTGGRCVSCGCAHGGKTHGETHAPLYRIWCSMTCRCRSDHPRYGGRGIEVCERWRLSYESFRDDMTATYHKGLQLERMDNDGPYSPQNCCWASRKMQNRNKSTNVFVMYRGERLTLVEAAAVSGLKKDTVQGRHKRGLIEETGLFAPVHHRETYRPKNKAASA